MNAFYTGALLTLVLGITTLKIDSSSISVYQASVCPIRLQQIFLSTWFKVEGQVVEWPTSMNQLLSMSQSFQPDNN